MADKLDDKSLGDQSSNADSKKVVAEKVESKDTKNTTKKIIKPIIIKDTSIW